MAKSISSEKALASGAKRASAQSAKMVFILFFVGLIGIFAQLSLVGKKKRYLITFFLIVGGIAFSIMQLMSIVATNDKMFEEAKVVYDVAGNELQANGETYACGDEPKYDTKVRGTLNYYLTDGGYFVGDVVVFPVGVNTVRLFANDGEITEEELEARYGAYKYKTNTSSRSTKLEYDKASGEFYQEWTYKIESNQDAHTIRYKLDKNLVTVSLKVDSKSDGIFEKSNSLNNKGEYVDGYTQKDYVQLNWNEESGKFVSQKYYVHSDKYDQTRTMMTVGFIAAGVGALLMWAFLIIQMGETKSYVKYMKQCEKKLPKEERKAFRKSADEFLNTGNMEGARALLEEHQFI